MVELFEDHVRQFDRHSSKGNQLKWECDGVWYKADYTGYEGLAEYVISQLLKKSTLDKNEFVVYELEQIKYKRQIFNGAKSNDFPTIMLAEVQAKTVCASFEEALDAAEKLYGYHLKFSFAKSDVGKLIDSAGIYSDEEKRRVETIIFQQMRKYQYLF